MIQTLPVSCRLPLERLQLGWFVELDGSNKHKPTTLEIRQQP
jgi:hypothetical protein